MISAISNAFHFIPADPCNMNATIETRPTLDPKGPGCTNNQSDESNGNSGSARCPLNAQLRAMMTCNPPTVTI